MKYVIPTVILLSLFVLSSGCASLSDRGAPTVSSFEMPDGSTMQLWERTKVNIWVPSTHMIKAYSGTTEIAVPDLLEQDGAGPGVLEATIHAAGLGVGLSQSGDTNDNRTNVSTSGGNGGNGGSAVSGSSIIKRGGYNGPPGRGRRFNLN